MQITSNEFPEKLSLAFKSHGYNLGLVSSPARRFDKRIVVTPDLPLSNIRVSAGLDTIKLVCRFDDRSAWRHLSDRIGQKLQKQSIYVNKWGAKLEGNNTQTCLVIIQNPTANGLKKLQTVRGLEEIIAIEGLDIAIDFRWSGSQSPDEANRRLDDLVEIMARHLSLRETVLGGNPIMRGYDPKTEKTRVSSGFLRYIETPAWSQTPTIYIGEKGQTQIRIYKKINDMMKDGKGINLPLELRSARFEICLDQKRLQELGLFNLDSLTSFDFSTLTNFCSFRLPVFHEVPDRPGTALWQAGNHLRPIEVERFMESGVMALEGEAYRPQGIKNPMSVSFNKINRRIHRALRELNAKISRGFGSTPRPKEKQEKRNDVEIK